MSVHPRLPALLTALVCLLGQGLNAQSSDFNWENRVSNGIAAVVEDTIITREELRREMEPLLPGIARRADSREEFERMAQDLARDVLQNLVDRVLIVKDFHDSGFQIPPNYIENRYEETIIVEFNGDRKAFLDFLRSQGKTPRQFREELKERIIVGVMRDDLRRTTSEVSPERIREYHRENSVKFMQEEAVHLRLILLSPKTDEPTSVLMQEAERIIERLEAGEPFEALAREASDDEKAEEGGDWGWISRGDLRSELVEPAFSLEEGQHSEPVVVDGNVFILYVEKRRDEGVQPLENVRDEIEEAISAHLARRAQQRWLERLREEAYVKYFVKDLMAQR